MRYIHCTKRLLNELNPETDKIIEEREVKGFGDWYSNIFQLGETVYLAFLNVKTLYAFIVSDIYRDEIDYFKNMFIFNFINSVELNGFENALLKEIVSEYSEIEFVKTNSRKYLGYLNDLIGNFIASTDENRYGKPMTVEEFNRNIVKNPIKAFKYKNPLEKFQELVDNEIL